MSVTLIEKEIRLLLSRREPEVVCISGHWGVGKTFAWRRYLAEAQATPGGVALNHYSYVSLFGINSLEDFKYAIFENTVSAKAKGQQPGLDTLKRNAIDLAKQAKKAIPFVQQVPYLKNVAGAGVAPLWFMWVRETIVCVDDIERRGDKLTVRDVLGLVSHLKEQKKCKVVMILNDEKLQEETEKFRTYFEKVVDISLRFDPTPEESARIALTDADKLGALIARHCMQLGIANIRLIKKIERAVRAVEPFLSAFDEAVIARAVQSLVLLAWCIYEPSSAPPLEYVQTFDAFLIGMNKDEPIDEDEAAWNGTLRAYNFTSMDDMDRVLLDGVRDGYFDTDALKKHAGELDRTISEGKATNGFRQAWETFHGSFDDNQEEVLDTIFAALKENIKVISALDLNATVWLLKGLERPEQAAQAIDFYVEQEGGSRGLFDLDNLPFNSEVDDPDVRAAFAKKLETFKEEKNPAEILESITTKHGWSQADIDVLAALRADDYFHMFKSNKGDEMQRLIITCLEFGRMGDERGQYKAIAGHAREALKSIGQESPMNALRIRRYGLRIEGAHSEQELAAGTDG